MRRQYRAALAAYTLAAFCVLGGFLLRSRQTARVYHRMVTTNYRHAFTELASNVSQLDSTLQKCLYAGTNGMVAETCTAVFGAAASAKQALGELPYSDREFEQTSGFISRVGDYAFMLSKKAAGGGSLSDEERGGLKKLSEATSVLAGNLTGMLAEVNSGALNLDSLDSLSKKAAKAGEEATTGFSDRVKAAEGEFPETPTLIYDGPFSSHIAGMKPQFLEGKSEVAQEQAQRTAAEFTKLQNITFDGERGGNLPVYMFSAQDGGDTANIEVSKAGGIVVNVYSSHQAKNATVPQDKAVVTAKEFLDKHGYAGLRESYRQATGNLLTVNFAAEKDGVICYPDLIKAVVALDTGKVVGFEAQGYVMHHHERTLPEVKVTEEGARTKVSPQLTVLSHELAVIPTEGKNEVFCHEFKCETAEGQHYIVYVNAETGAEAKILMLLENENGTLTV